MAPETFAALCAVKSLPSAAGTWTTGQGSGSDSDD